MNNAAGLKVVVIVILLIAGACSGNKTDQSIGEKVGVLLVNHGSHSKLWRDMLFDVENSVKDEVLTNQKVSKVKTAFMEYNEPSIATRLKEFDEDGYDHVVVVPIFLTVSSHYSHDIPVICGISVDKKIQAELAKEKIEVYKPTARVTIVPPLDYTTLLKKNVERRVKALSKNPENEGVVLVAYGDAQYNQQWMEMVDDIKDRAPEYFLCLVRSPGQL